MNKPPTQRAVLLPLYFDPGRNEGFDIQLDHLRTLFGDQAEFLEPIALGSNISAQADAVIFPQLLGEAYRQLKAFKALNIPILVVTSEFGTLSMWDWEVRTYLESEGVGPVIAPYDVADTRTAIKALQVKRQLRSTKFLIYQDNPGEGQQAPIFKRFYWWEDECTARMVEKFGVTIEKRSYRELGARAKAIPDSEADALWEHWKLPTAGVTPQQLHAALKLYIATKADLDEDPSIRGVGINCLNESHFSDSTPCLAWNMLYQEHGFIWGCEADIMSMLTKFVLNKSLEIPVMMTNLYPFLLGNAALKHERIAAFPEVESEPENYILVAHCGYMGVIPQDMAKEGSWTLRKKVLGIVDEQATAIDANLPEGPITLTKLHPNMARLTVIEGELKGYAQYPGSDCLNGGVIKVPDGHGMMERLSSHHYLLSLGHRLRQTQLISKVFGLEVCD
jgi:hypothetical protein